MRLPLRLDEELLIVYDAAGDTVCSGYIGTTARWNAEQVRNLRRLVVSANWARHCNTDAMEQQGELPFDEALRLSVDPETHFGPGPGRLRLVRNEEEGVSK